MKICINSRNLSEFQQARIENYFHMNFSFDLKRPTLVWMDEASGSILLGYGHGDQQEMEAYVPPSLMFRVHEHELQYIAGRDKYGCHDGQRFRA